MNILPFTKYPHFIEQVTLDGVAYTFKFDWNSRGEFWSVSVYDATGTGLLLGLKLMNNGELYKRYSKTQMPPGMIGVINNTGSFQKITYDDVGRTCDIVYLTGVECGVI